MLINLIRLSIFQKQLNRSKALALALDCKFSSMLSIECQGYTETSITCIFISYKPQIVLFGLSSFNIRIYLSRSLANSFPSYE